MHEVEPRLLVEHVAVQRGDLDAVLPQRLEHRIDLLAQEHEVAGDRRLAVTGRLERDAGRDPERPGRGERYAGLVETVRNGVLRKARIEFAAREAFFLRGRADASIDQQRGCAVVIERRDAEHAHQRSG